MISEDEYLERVVAGIHAASSADADVCWNEVINGRQFDVVIRFQLGTLRYLVLIEVKNRTRRASASDVEAFVTKARDQNANKAVFVTAAGFQEGAMDVARRHGVDMFTVTFDATEVDLSTAGSFAFQINPDATGTAPLEFEVGEPLLVTIIENVRLLFTDGSSFELPSEASQMTYYAEKTILSDGRTLGQLMMSVPGWSPALDETRQEEIRVDPPLRIEPPDQYYFPSGMLGRLNLTIAGRMSRPLSGNVRIETSSFRCPVVYTNVLTGEASRYTLDKLPLNTGPVTPGNFYFQVHPLRYFYCDSRIGSLIRWHLVESFQSGQLIRSTYTQQSIYGAFYIPVRDKEILKRLEGRLRDYLSLSGHPSSRPGFRTPPRSGSGRRSKKRRRQVR
ncbi:MAG: restriction endonuclease [Sphingomonas sp.]|nr:restriction endonuclease [Sphingomonas sp.]